MAIVNFKKGLRAGLPATYSEGTFYVTTDERAIYLDVSDSARIRLGDFQEFATVAALEANPNPSTTALYYVTDINCMAKWDGSKYVQINTDTGMTSVDVVGEGNAVTAAVYSADGRKLTLTKGATYMTAADVDGKISTAVGALGNDAEGNAYANVKAYVDAKTSGIATDAALGELQTRVATAEGEIDTLQAASHTHENATVLAGITAEKVAAWDAAESNAEAHADGLNSAMDTRVKALESAVGDEGSVADKIDAAVSAETKAREAAVSAVQGEVDALEGKVGEVPEGKTVVQMIADAQTAATYDDTKVKADIKANADAIDAIEADYLKAADKTELSDAIDAEKSRAEGIESGLRTDVDAIKADYLKAADKTALQEQITTNANAIERLTNGVSAEEIDGVNDLINYVNEHGTEVTGMKDAIAANAKAIEDQATADAAKYETKDDASAKLTEAKNHANGLNTAMDVRVKALEGIDHDAYVEADKTVLTDAKAYTDEKNGEMDTRVKALEAIDHDHANKAELDLIASGDKAKWDAAAAKAHEHANAAELDKIADGDVAKWNAAQANAEATAATALSAAKTELEGKITAAGTAANSYTDTEVKKLADGAVATNTTDIAVLKGDDKTEGSVAKALADAKAYADTAESDAITTANAYTDNALTWGSF